jgi:hypothetical protein
VRPKQEVYGMGKVLKTASVFAVPALLLAGIMSMRRSRKKAMQAAAKKGWRVFKWRPARRGLLAAGKGAARVGAFIMARRAAKKTRHVFG